MKSAFSFALVAALVQLSPVAAQAAKCPGFDVEGLWENNRGIRFEIIQQGCNSAQLIDRNLGVVYPFNFNGEETSMNSPTSPADTVKFRSQLWSNGGAIINAEMKLPEIFGARSMKIGFSIDARVSGNTLFATVTRTRILKVYGGEPSVVKKAFVDGANSILTMFDSLISSAIAPEMQLHRVR